MYYVYADAGQVAADVTDAGHAAVAGHASGSSDSSVDDGPGPGSGSAILGSPASLTRRTRLVPDLKCGIVLWSQAVSWPEMLKGAKRVDNLGYDSLWAWDHLYSIFGDPYQPIFDGWSTIAAWAIATKRPRLGLLVGAN